MLKKFSIKLIFDFIKDSESFSLGILFCNENYIERNLYYKEFYMNIPLGFFEFNIGFKIIHKKELNND
jgi:hypothetical protein